VLEEEQCPVMLHTAPHYNMLQHAAIYIKEGTCFVAGQRLDGVSFVDCAIVQSLCVCFSYLEILARMKKDTPSLCKHTQNYYTCRLKLVKDSDQIFSFTYTHKTHGDLKGAKVAVLRHLFCACAHDAHELG